MYYIILDYNNHQIIIEIPTYFGHSAITWRKRSIARFAGVRPAHLPVIKPDWLSNSLRYVPYAVKRNDL